MAEAGIRVAKERGLQLRAAAEAAIESIGLGYDLTLDLRLKYCKNNHSCDADPRLITIDIDDKVRDIAIPGGILVQNVSKSIKCDKGERLRFSSDVLSFQQMSEQFNQDLSLSGKIPTGHFNAAFEFSGCWQKDAANTKALAFDGVFITLYSIVLEKSQVALRDYVKQAVPSSWDPAALARKSHSLQCVSQTIVQEIRKLLLVHPMLVLVTKTASSGDKYSTTEGNRNSGQWSSENTTDGRATRRGPQILAYREYMPSVWQMMEASTKITQYICPNGCCHL